MVVAFGTEILHAHTCFSGIRDHGRAPVLEVLDAADLDVRAVNVDPLIREEVLLVDDKPDNNKRSVGEAAGGREHIFRGFRGESGHEPGDRHAGDDMSNGNLHGFIAILDIRRFANGPERAGWKQLRI